MIFLIDAQLPPALARWLTQQGHTAQHVDDIDLRQAEDMEIWNQALSIPRWAQITTLLEAGNRLVEVR